MLISFKHFRRSFSSARAAKGFTLVELLVVSAIILLMTSYIFFQQSKFNSTTLLRSLSYNIALSVRQAQIYGTSVRESSRGSGVFVQGYGVYVPSAGATSDIYYIFADLNGNGAYDAGEELPRFNLGKGYRISDLCAVLVGGSTCTTPSRLTMYFRRPNPDACISNNQDSACATAATPAVYSRAYITVSNSGNTDSRRIMISQTGQISVCAPNSTSLTTC